MLYSGDDLYGDEITSPTEIPASYYRSYEPNPRPNTNSPLAREDEQPQSPARSILQKLAEHQATECFVESYVQSTPQETLEIEGLGIALAHWAQWDGVKLMYTFMAALEDANFYGEAGQVQEMINRYLKGD